MITITYECRRPKFDVDANQKKEVLTLTPSYVAAVGVLINGRALSTQTPRSVLTYFAICPLLVLLLLIPSITSLRALAELFFRCLQVPTFIPFPVRVRELTLRRGNVHPTLFRNFDPISTRNPYHNTITVCRSTQSRQRTCVNQLVLREDWNLDSLRGFVL